MRTLYFDCFSGASGNMILGALLALGIDRNALETELSKLNLPDVSLMIENVDRSGISATHVEVIAPDQHAHRHLSNIVKIIESSDLADAVKSRAITIFTRLAEAEARVHGISVEKVHFHEVGAIDAIVDIVGACIGFEMLGIERFVCSKIHVGSGFVQMDHGKFPVPPPAVAELLKGIPIYSTEIEGELITPTAAAIISTICESYGQIPEVRVEGTSYGAGTRTYKDFPNVLRLMVGTSITKKNAVDSLLENLVLIETNLDDVSSQILGFVMERAFEIGALDCWFTPIQMKKNRPASMISILCPKEKREVLSKLLYDETTTLGLRIRSVERECLEREFRTVSTRYGNVDVKIAKYNGKVSNIMPEYEQVRSLAVKNNVPFREIQNEVFAELERKGLAAAANE
jgi:uncharacterized protein (TIGR00299 family) protein